MACKIFIELFPRNGHNPEKFFYGLWPKNNCKKMKRKVVEGTSYATIKKEVFKKKIEEKTVRDMIRFVEAKQLNMWGREKTSFFVGRNVYLCLWKDLYKHGFNYIEDQIRDWMPLSSKSLQHNLQEIRLVLKGRTEELVVLQETKVLRRQARKAGLPKAVCDIELWIDSVDCRMDGKASTSRKDPSWSYKENSPAQRYQVVSSAAGRIQKIWGRYSPKVFDGNWLNINKQQLVELFRNRVFVADCHYEWGKENLKGIKFHVPFPRPRGKKKAGEKDGANLRVLTKEQQKYNADVKKARARVESPFGLIKTKWGCLKEYFAEGPEQLDALVWIACGVHNFQLPSK